MSNKQCNYCKGHGLLKLRELKTCSNCNGKRCFLCDRSGPYKTFEECNKCLGTGVSNTNNEKCEY